jgi:hypothetical protein
MPSAWTVFSRAERREHFRSYHRLHPQDTRPDWKINRPCQPRRHWIEAASGRAHSRARHFLHYLIPYAILRNTCENNSRKLHEPQSRQLFKEALNKSKFVIPLISRNDDLFSVSSSNIHDLLVDRRWRSK